MTYTLIVRPLAEEDLRKARRWYDRQLPGLGQRFLIECDRSFQRICANPFHYADVYRGIRLAMTHRFPYAIYFRVQSDCVIASAVIHVRRSDRRWKSRLNS